MKNLQDIIQFKHEGVIRRFKKEFPNQEANAEVIFKDLMLFFWASKTHENLRLADPTNADLDFVFIMDEEMKAIDHMWHVFLLYTQDYMDFCAEYFGEYLHHLPDVIPNGKILVRDVSQNLERFLVFVNEQLGEEVLMRWFSQSVESAKHESESDMSLALEALV